MAQTLLNEETFDFAVEWSIKKVKEITKIPVPDFVARMLLNLAIDKAEDFIPDNFEEAIKQSLEDNNTEALINETAELVNEKVNIPFMKEETEGELFKILLYAIVEAITFGIKKLTEKDGEETEA